MSQYRGQPRRLFGVIVLVILLLLILLTLLFFFPRPRATATLTPAHNTSNNSLTTSILSRNLYSSPQDSQSGDSTGQPKSGIQATGELTFHNYTSSEVTVPAGTPFTNKTGQEIVTNDAITVPPDPPVIPGVKYALAHAVKPGKAGNIPAMSVDTTYKSPDVKVFNESDFTGGLDATTTHTVLQADVDKVAKPLETSLKQKALDDLQKQLKPGEKLVNPTPQCSTNTTSNPGVGESADKFTVTVSVACSDAAYDPQPAFRKAEDQLKQTAAQQYPGYVLEGPIATKVEKVTPRENGNVDVLASATGTWKYPFTDADKLNIKKNIARKTKSDAIAWLKQQKGVQDASITVTGPIIDLSGGNTVPDDLSAIDITIKNVAPQPGPNVK